MPSLDFKGKAFVYAHHLTVPFRELVPDAKKSCLTKGAVPAFDGNLIIHGDNLHALKALLPLYAGKVDCVFIDPPYNTGHEGWRYNDNVRSPLMKEWIKKHASPSDEGVTRDDLERHDKWACMMWPRLKLLNELLSPTGSFWITLDDNEVHQAKSLLDEIFGADCFVGQLAWQKRTSRENRAPLSPSIDHLLLYSKCLPDSWKLVRNLIPVEPVEEVSDDEESGVSGTIPFSAQGFRKNQVYKITTPTGVIHLPPKGRCWGATEPEFEKLKAEDRIYWPKNGNGRPRVKPATGHRQGLVPNTLWLAREVGDTEGSKKLLLEIFSEREELGIHAPKPHELIERVIQISTNPNSIVLDSFAGSGTTAHAVLAQNKKDGGERRFILVECEDYADTLTAERVRRVIRGYPFSGTKRTELMREPLNWTKLKKADALVEKAESIKQLEGADYDEVKITVEAGELVVTGEMTIKDKAPGIPGAFTYCTLGAEMSLEGLLTGKALPAFEALAKYVFYTATGRTLATVAKQPANGGDGFIGEVEHYRVHLLYQPDQAWLRSEAAVLTETKVEAIVAGRPAGQRSLVFAAAKYLSQKDLTGRGVEFCQLPYAIHRILGESAAPRA
jgi:adenine-specific DNA-methyltransferase